MCLTNHGPSSGESSVASTDSLSGKFRSRFQYSLQDNTTFRKKNYSMIIPRFVDHPMICWTSHDDPMIIIWSSHHHPMTPCDSWHFLLQTRDPSRPNKWSSGKVARRSFRGEIGGTYASFNRSKFKHGNSLTQQQYMIIHRTNNKEINVYMYHVVQ